MDVPFESIVYTSETYADFLDGMWRVTSNIIERRLKPDLQWEEEKVAAMGIDTTFEAAYKTAVTSVVNQFNDVLLKNKTGCMFPTPTR